MNECRSIDNRLYSQVFYLEACWEAGSSEFCDVIIAQIQSFHGRQSCDPTAVYSAYFIMMSGGG